MLRICRGIYSNLMSFVCTNLICVARYLPTLHRYVDFGDDSGGDLVEQVHHIS
jgi:hypothetical protein